MGIEASARLIYWFGVNSPWPASFDEFNNRLSLIQQKKGQLTVTAALARAKAWKALSVEDFTSAAAEVKTTTSSDPENIFMAEWLQWRADGIILPKEKRSVLPSGRVYEFLAAQMYGRNDVLTRLSESGYLPAEVAVFVAEKPSSDRAVAAEVLEGRVALYPFLRLQVLDVLAESLSVAGDNGKARDVWKKVLEVNPRLGKVWLKLAQSFQDEALWDEALLAYQSAQQAHVLNEFGYVGYMKLLRMRNKVVEALKVFDEGAAAFPKSAKLYLEKGFTQVAIFQEEQARQSFNKALQLEPTLDGAQFGLVQLALARRDWIEAETLLKKISENSPEYGESLLRLAQIAVEQNRYKDAETTYRRALEKNQKLERAYADLVTLYLIDEKEDKAAELLDRGFGQLPRSPLLQVARARVEASRGNWTAAIETVEKVRKGYDHLPEVNLAYADFLIQTKELRKAFSILDQYKTQEGHMPEVGYLKVKAFLVEPENPQGLGSAELATKVIDGVLRARPDDLRYRLAAAQVALAMQDKKGAVEHIDLMMKARPDYAPALVIRADFFKEAGDCNNAISLYEEALKQTKKKGPIFRKLAQCYRSEGKPAQAISYYQKVTQSDGSDAESFLELGRLLSEDGKFQGAMKALSTVVQLSPTTAEAYYLLGFVYKELGNKRQAVASFNRFLELSPNAIEASTVRDEVFFLRGGALANP